MPTVGIEQPEAGKESRVNQALHDQSRVVERLDAAVERLTDSMEAALRDPEPAETNGADTQAPSCQLEEAILSNTRRMDKVIVALNDLIERNQL